jgi:hypothetical protein
MHPEHVAVEVVDQVVITRRRRGVGGDAEIHVRVRHLLFVALLLNVPPGGYKVCANGIVADVVVSDEAEFIVTEKYAAFRVRVLSPTLRGV